MRYRLYIDESGDHTTTDPSDVGKRYLGLVAVAIPQGSSYAEFAKSLAELKGKHLRAHPDEETPILHREDIISRRKWFSVLRDEGCRAAFDADLVEWIVAAEYKVFGVVIDKHTHGRANIEH